MEMIERYLQAVKFALPEKQRDDIIKELRDSILSQVEEKEEELGRPLNEQEHVDLLKKLGSPMHLAARYRKRRSLIGATMFPVYWKVLKASLGLAMLSLAAGSIATAAAGKTLTESLGVLTRIPGVALMVFAWITLTFSALEFFGGKFQAADSWNPRSLPPMMKNDPAKSRFELITQFLLQTIFGVWWLAGLHYQYLILGPGVAFFRFGPVWQSIYPLFVVMVVTDLMLTAAMLAWPGWTLGRPVTRLVRGILGLAAIYFLMSSPDVFVAADAGSAHLQILAKNLNYWTHLGLQVSMVVTILAIAIEAMRIIGERHGNVHHATV